MNKLICTLITVSVFTAGAAFGQAKPQPINDTQMDNVTAGQTETGGSAGSVAANNSTVTATDTSSVTLSGSALNGAKGVNVVSASGSSVGNGVNVYDDSLTTDDKNSGATVNQGNSVDQSTATGAVLIAAPPHRRRATIP